MRPMPRSLNLSAAEVRSAASFTLAWARTKTTNRATLVPKVAQPAAPHPHHRTPAIADTPTTASPSRTVPMACDRFSSDLASRRHASRPRSYVARASTIRCYHDASDGTSAEGGVVNSDGTSGDPEAAVREESAVLRYVRGQCVR